MPDASLVVSSAFGEKKFFGNDVIGALGAFELRGLRAKVEAFKPYEVDHFAVCNALLVCTQAFDVQSRPSRTLPQWLEWKSIYAVNMHINEDYSNSMICIAKVCECAIILSLINQSVVVTPSKCKHLSIKLRSLTSY